MAFNSQSSGPSLPEKRVSHVAVTWNNAILIWGGRIPDNYDINTRSIIYYHKYGKWSRKETSGAVPPDCGPEAQVLEDKMFVPYLHRGNNIVIHFLDLQTWIWTRLTPGGTQPSSHIFGNTSWAHNGKIYSFGCGGPTGESPNQLVCYNISTNSWEWPDTGGDTPQSRRNHLTIISDDTVFLFGGVSDRSPSDAYYCYNDLHILDMKHMIWKKVHDNISTVEGPDKEGMKTSRYTFTLLNQSTAVVIGMRYDIETKHFVDDCWLLNLRSAMQFNIPSSIWTKAAVNFARVYHAAILQPMSKRLWVIGGHNIHDSTADVVILKINFGDQPSPLKYLAMDIVARNVCAHDPRLVPDQLPEELSNEIEAYRCELGEQIS